jgi:hypothetical protein
VRAGEVNAETRALESFDRLPVKALGGIAGAEQRARAGLDPEC